MFGSSTKTVVGSSAYNLAGEPHQRGNYLKNTIMSSVLSGSSRTNGLGNDIYKSHIEGPGAKLLSYASWSERSGYEHEVGRIEGILMRDQTVDVDILNMIKPLPVGKERRVVQSIIDGVQYQFLAESYIAANLPHKVGKEFTVGPETVTSSGFRPTTTLTGKLVINFTSPAEKVVFTPSINITNTTTVLYVWFLERTIIPPINTDAGTEVFEDENDLTPLGTYTGSFSPWQDTVYSLSKVTTVTVTYSDETPSTVNTTTTNTDQIAQTRTGTFQRTYPNEVLGQSTDRTTTKNITYTHTKVWQTTTTTSTETLPGGVVATTTTTVEQQFLEPRYEEHTFHVDEVVENWGNTQTLAYAQGTNTSIDALVFGTKEVPVGRYLPIIPLRHHNVAVDNENYPEQYGWSKKAAKKAFGKNKSLDTLLENLESNESIKDIDNAWCVFAVSLGSEQNDGQLYLYQFFKTLSESVIYTPNRYKDVRDYAAAMEAYWPLLEAYENPPTDDDGNIRGPRPPLPIRPQPQRYTFKTFISNAWGGIEEQSRWHYNIDISAAGGEKFNGTGYHPRSKDKVGTAWRYIHSSVSIKQRGYSGGEDAGHYYYYDEVQVIRFGTQITEDSWEEYEFFDLVHTNHVLNGYTVQTYADEGISKGENGSFLVPLNEGVFRDMNIIRRTQLSLECSYLVINYYERIKVPWYASGFFQIVIVVVVIVVAVYTGGIGAGTAGMLGTAGAVGAALGFTGMAAVVAGAIANALAAAIVSAIITQASTAIFGDKFGKIIGAVVSMVVTWGAANNWNFSSMNPGNMLQNMTKADNLLKMTMSGVQMYGEHMAMKAQEVMAETASLVQEYEEQMERINAMTQEFLGNTGIDPMTISEATRMVLETPEDFMTRTLMTGDDIVETTIGLIEDFPTAELYLKES